MIEELCNQIFRREDFQKEYEKLCELNYNLQFRQNIKDFSNNNLVILIKRLLQCATTFALSDEIRFRSLAYEIAVMSQNIDGKLGDIECVSRIVPLVFTRLGNFPAEFKYLKEHNSAENINLPISLWFEQEAHRLSNTVKVSSKHQLTLTDFQLQLWDSVNTYPITIVNAPTSAGKSFILQNHIVNSLAVDSECKNALYIVPTRALIEQVVNDFRDIIKKADVSDIVITSIPEVDDAKKTIYVLTQERTQLLFENSLNLDLVVIDEAQNVSDNARGIILQSVIETIKKQYIDVKLIFAMPFVQNPSVFLNMFSLDENKCNIIPAGESPVRQNLFSVTVNNTNNHYFEISKLTENGSFSSIGSLYTELEIVNEKKYLAILALEAGKEKNNIVYGNEPRKCEEIAQLISQQLPEEIENSELIEFSNFIKEHIHKDYLLAETVRHGVAYHYGKLPSFIRKGIERLCSTGDIKYIVCTSTLLQGINLPAQNIFIMNPSKGQDSHRKSIPMNAPDFWNLAGRAGRLTKDFEGNVFLLNLDEWEINPIDEREKQTVISPSFRRCVCDLDSGLCEYIENTNHKSGDPKTQNVENAFMKLYFLSSEDKLENTLNSFGSELHSEQKTRIINAINNAKSKITIPYNIAVKNPNVSIFRQQALYDYFSNKADADIESFIPPHPLHSFQKIKDSYIDLFNIYDRIIANENNQKYLFFYWFALDWMHGNPYSDMLKNQIDYKNKTLKRGRAKVNTEARKLFDDIESSLRFTYVKFSKCYNDILAYVLQINGLEDLIDSIPALHLYLELGASSKTMINFIGIGLSRTAAWILSQKATNSSLSRDEALNWLKNTNLNALDIPQSVIVEVSQII